MKKTYIWLIIISVFVIYLLLSSIFGGTTTKKLSGGYTYSSDHKHIIGATDIPPNVIDYVYDKDFILVKQKPKEFDEAIYDKMEYNYPHGRDSTYYWLIIVKNKVALGPLDINEFNKAISEYNVPPKLILN